jgi:aerobic-type carbon monoxide dehydrogenase small subunit (CoxS/CutS family)
MIYSKKGQGMSLNVIIIAALALIVLVVLIAIFMGRIGTFKGGVDKAGQEELVKMQINYGQCRPGTVAETTFTLDLAKATDDTAKDQARSKFEGEISRCKGFSNDKIVCESNTGCKWSS